jgi:hypothetical protein
MKGIIAFFGESFRLGSQGSRDIGSDASLLLQKKATESHLDFIDFIDKGGTSMDIVVNTYETRLSEHLSVYAPLVCNLNKNRMGLQPIFDQTCDLVSREIKKTNYDFVFFSRVDLIFKQAMKDKFRVNHERILWPSVCFWNWHRHGDSPRVNDTMLIVPKKHFNLIANRQIQMGHHGWDHLKRLIGNEGQGLLLDSLHDSDSQKDWNPIYMMAGRPENKKFHSEGMRIEGLNIYDSQMNVIETFR